MTIADRYEMYNDAMYVMQHYGITHQTIKTLEEMCELGAELVRDLNNDERASDKNILEEIADVEVMLLQLRMYYEGTTDISVEDIMAMKLDRAVKAIPPIELDIADLDPLGEACAEPAAIREAAEHAL